MEDVVTTLEPTPTITLKQAVPASAAALRARLAAALRGAATAVPVDARAARELDFLLGLLVRAIGEGRDRTVAAHHHDLARIGAAWARRGVPLGELVAAHRIAQRTVVDYVRTVGRERGSSAADVVDAIDAVLVVCTAIATAVSAGYQQAGHPQAGCQQAGHQQAGSRPAGRDRQRAHFVRGLLWGTLEPAELDRHARMHDLDTEREFLALRARPAPGRTSGELARAHGFTSGRAPCGGLGAVVDGDLVGFLGTAPKASVPGVSGLGPGRPLARLHESFRMASRALDTADRRGLTGVQEFGKLGLLPAVFCDVMVGEALCRKYLTSLGDSDSAVEIVDTVRAYLANGMNVGRTAERMFVHPNTVRYRIGRFEELTGASLRSSPKTVFELLWVLEHRSTMGCTRMPRTCAPRSCAPESGQPPAGSTP
jgi:hypothetical protein